MCALHKHEEFTTQPYGHGFLAAVQSVCNIVMRESEYCVKKTSTDVYSLGFFFD